MRPIASLALILHLALFTARAADKNQTWTDPQVAAREDPDFLLQGEYGSEKIGGEFGVQVVAMGNGKFDAWLLEGGLPGLGWTPESKRVAMKGKRDGDAVTIVASDGAFSGEIRGGVLKLLPKAGKAMNLSRIERISPTLGLEPPKGAVVLFNGSSADQWERGRMENGLLAATNALSKKAFYDYTLHLEFRTPYKPQARGQDRGNSGIYYGGRWETQVLDSFGLEGKDNETGGIYSIAEPLLNMCLPPLTWQTYDVDFTAARFDDRGRRTAWPRITVKLNGVLVHEDLELNKDFTTAAPLKGKLETPEGPIFLQNHGNPVFYRNIWVKPKK